MTLPNETISFELVPSVAQPYSKPVKDNPHSKKVYTGAAIHLYSQDLIIVYYIIQYGVYGEGFLVIPSSSPGKLYIVSAYNNDPIFCVVCGYRVPSMVSIVAAYDNTKVRFSLGNNHFTETAAELKIRDSPDVLLYKKVVRLLMSKNNIGDLT